jgi:hypothetical protein
MELNSRPRSATVVSSALVAAFMVFVLSSSALGSAVAAPAGGTPQTLWAYGYVKSVSVGPLVTSDGWIYQGDATVGYSVILNQINTSSTTFELSVERTMGVLFFVEFCRPSCSSPTSFANLSYHAWEVTDSWANFTTQGAVTENGASVSALALLNTSSTVDANVTESTHSALPSSDVGGLGGLVDRSKYLSAEVSSASNVTFATPLGLFPLSLTGAQSWTSTSAFSALGRANYSYYYHLAGPLAPKTVGPVSGQLTGSISHSGNVTVVGSYSPKDTVVFDGVTYPALELIITGPFSVREGFILIPTSVDLFGASSEPWATVENGTGTVTMSYLDAKASAGGHVGIAASSWLYSLSATNSADTTLTADSGLIPASGSATNSVAATSVQGTPETVAAAQSSQPCLTTGVGCPGASSSSSVRGLFVEVAGAAVVVAVVALIAILLIAERRRVPPPVYPNANLYPPGPVAGAPQRPTIRPGETPPPPAEEDPLDHLW